MKDQKVVGRKGQFRVGLALVVGEFDFVGAVEEFHNGTHLAAQETMRGHIRKQSDDVE